MNATVTSSATSVVSARGLRKAYKNKVALDDTAFEIPAGRIVGLIGPNGAGKTTALKAMLGLIPFEGELRVLGRDPRTERDELMMSASSPTSPCSPAGSGCAKPSTSSPACTRGSTARVANASLPTRSSSRN
jgi:energy-coupling factor transporter ATP-binding protein EcfA2